MRVLLNFSWATIVSIASGTVVDGAGVTDDFWMASGGVSSWVGTRWARLVDRVPVTWGPYKWPSKWVLIRYYPYKWSYNPTHSKGPLCGDARRIFCCLQKTTPWLMCEIFKYNMQGFETPSKDLDGFLEQNVCMDVLAFFFRTWRFSRNCLYP